MLLLLILSELVLSLDNVLVIYALANKSDSPKLWTISGILISAILRILLLLVIGIAISNISGILPYLILAGGFLLIYTALHENKKQIGLKIVLLDIIFSLDSVLAGLAFTSDLYIIAGAIILTTIPMLIGIFSLNKLLTRFNPKYIILLLGLFMIGKAIWSIL